MAAARRENEGDYAYAMKDDRQQEHQSVIEESGPRGTWLFPFIPTKQPQQLHPIVLAYIGDAIFEIAIRQYLISRPNHRPNHLHREAIGCVSAKAQARALTLLTPHLTNEESAVVRQGRNAKSSVPKSANVSEYRQATALESLFGYLYLSGNYERLQKFANMIVQAHEKKQQHD